MQLKSFLFPNSYSNYGYILGCEKTGSAIAIDPFRAQEVIDCLAQEDWKLTAILNTHSHWDHVGGNQDLMGAYNCEIYGSKQANSPAQTRTLEHGQSITFGETIHIKVFETPGHTMDSLSFIANDTALFTGDTLFNYGCGNCKHGGKVESLFRSLAEHYSGFEPHLLVHPGHDYKDTNRAFSQAMEEKGIMPFREVEGKSLHHERIGNPFLRSSDPSCPEYDPDTFFKLRELRNTW